MSRRTTPYGTKINEGKTMKTKIYLSGSIVPEGKASVSVFDRGLNYGDGLFETMKAHDGKPAFLKEHLQRLKAGARFLKIPINALEADVKDGVIERLLKANRLSKGSACVKIIVTRGVDKSGHAPSKGTTPTLIIITKRIDETYIVRLQKKGVKAILIKGYAPALGGFKTLNYLPCVLAKAEAERRGAFEGIFVGEDGTIKEGSSTNIFIVSKGILKTPPANAQSGILPGVTRQAVISIAKKLGLTVKEAPISVKDLFTCDKAFLTNSIIGMVPLVSVDSRRIGRENNDNT